MTPPSPSPSFPVSSISVRGSSHCSARERTWIGCLLYWCRISADMDLVIPCPFFIPTGKPLIDFRCCVASCRKSVSFSKENPPRGDESQVGSRSLGTCPARFKEDGRGVTSRDPSLLESHPISARAASSSKVPSAALYCGMQLTPCCSSSSFNSLSVCSGKCAPIAAGGKILPAVQRPRSRCSRHKTAPPRVLGPHSPAAIRAPHTRTPAIPN
mmetsp:Transcript_34380/g.81436  ORF Transcript_34380/g.81436 Transcript_34380/m.81436 type:complete len:213 (-) Transcript_34380:69-707(-)